MIPRKLSVREWCLLSTSNQSINLVFLGMAREVRGMSFAINSVLTNSV